MTLLDALLVLSRPNSATPELVTSAERERDTRLARLVADQREAEAAGAHHARVMARADEIMVELLRAAPLAPPMLLRTSAEKAAEAELHEEPEAGAASVAPATKDA